MIVFQHGECDHGEERAAARHQRAAAWLGRFHPVTVTLTRIRTTSGQRDERRGDRDTSGSPQV